MEIEPAAIRKTELGRIGKRKIWIEPASFGLGQISESRQHKLDIEFVSGARRRSEIDGTETSRIPESGFQVPKGVAVRASGQYCSFFTILSKVQCALAYKTITPLGGADLQTPTSKLEWETRQ
jgi:hypothetical protein